MIAVLLGRIVDRVLPIGGEDLRRHLVAHFLEDLQLAALWQPLRGKVRVIEVAVGAPVKIEEELLVGFLEVEGEGECLAHARVLELLATQVEHERLHRRGGALGGDRFLLDPPFRHGGKVVAGRPLAGDVLSPIVELARLELFERRRAVEEIAELDFVEVPLALGDGQVLRPIVLDALIGDRAPGIDRLDLVGARAQRDLERRLGDVALLAVGAGAFPEMLGQYRDLPDDLRQLAVGLDVECEGDLVLAGLLCLYDVLVVEGVLRMRLLLGLQAEDHILGRDRRAVMPTRLGAQPERHGGIVVGVGNPLRDLAVFGGGLIGARGHERIVDEPQARCRRAAHRERVEAVEGSFDEAAQRAALGRVRIDPVEVVEVGAVLGLAHQRERMMSFRTCGRGGIGA